MENVMMKSWKELKLQEIFDVENYNCSTHKYENKKNNYKSISVVDTFIRLWNMDNNHQKYEKIAIVWNVGISEDDENIMEG